METIHLKSVDPLSQELLRSASRRGIKLNWERYERQQPQDGFVRLGLTCPIGCMQGPCRIDPFRRGAEKGICGLTGDGMVAAFLLRLVQQGLLETLAAKKISFAGEVPWPPALAKMAATAMNTLGGAPLSLSEVLDTAVLLQRTAATPEGLLRKALRLGLMTVALRGEAAAPVSEQCLPLRVGYGLLTGGKINIGVTGNPPQELVIALLEKIKADAAPAQVLSLGDWIPLESSYLPIVCTSGEAELAVSSGNIGFILAGPDADPALSELCRTLDVPFLLADGTAGSADEILSMARVRGRCAAAPVTLDPSCVAEGFIWSPQNPINGANTLKKVALLGGADDLRHSMGYLPVELAFALGGQEFAVGAWEDAALWMIKNGFTAANQENPAIILNHVGGPLTVITALAAAGRLGELRGTCFTGLTSCADLALGLGLAALGTNVCLAIPLPIWGSEQVRGLLAEILARQGGVLTHFDHPAGLSEIVSWFTGK